MNDPISDMLIRIKNASRARKESVQIPYSKIKLEIARILKDKDYISKCERKGKKSRKFIELAISYNPDGTARLSDVRRVSKLSRRVYKPARDIKKIKQGYGIAIVSTSKGLKTDAEARKDRLGGEIICEIW